MNVDKVGVCATRPCEAHRCLFYFVIFMFFLVACYVCVYKRVSCEIKNKPNIDLLIHVNDVALGTLGTDNKTSECYYFNFLYWCCRILQFFAVAVSCKAFALVRIKAKM